MSWNSDQCGYSDAIGRMPLNEFLSNRIATSDTPTKIDVPNKGYMGNSSLGALDIALFPSMRQVICLLRNPPIRKVGHVLATAGQIETSHLEDK